MKCPQCENDNPDQAKFCFNCGFNFSRKEPTQGQNEDKYAKYIPQQLLAKLEESAKLGGVQGERRIVTMLFCDLVGSTATSEKLDPEEWSDIVNGAFDHLIPPVYQHEGILARLMGDGILAFFGAPISHEDDPERAILSGLEILQGINEYSNQVEKEWGFPINVRIGINTGLVVVGEIGSDMRVEYTAMGDAINIASRMESTADPGSLRVTENTYKHVAYLFKGEKIGPVLVKGKKDPITAYNILKINPTPSDRNSLSDFDLNFIGRERELDFIQTALEKTHAHLGQIIGITGEAGIGKSRLIREFQTRITIQGLFDNSRTNQNLLWLETNSFAYRKSTPFAPLIDLFIRHFGIEFDTPEDKKWELVKSKLAIFDDSHKMMSIAIFLGILLDIQDIPEIQLQSSIHEPQILEFKLKSSIIDYLSLLISSGPVILILDDIQWLDQSSRNLINDILPLIDKGSLLVILLMRKKSHENLDPILSELSKTYNQSSRIINLLPLSQQYSEMLITNLLKIEQLSQELHRVIIQKAEGNPFYISEIVHGLMDGHQIVFENNAWIVNPDIDKVQLPESLTSLLMARLDNLAEGTKRVAQTASVIGRDFLYKILTCLSISPDLASRVKELERNEWILDDPSKPEQSYFFKHLITREVAYNSLLLKTRRELHAKVASCLRDFNEASVEEIGRHYFESKDYEQAIPFLLLSAEKARRSNSTTEAVDILTQIKQVLDDKTDFNIVKKVYLSLGQALSMQGQMKASEANFNEILNMSKGQDDQTGVVLALNKLATNLVYSKREIEQADKYLTEAEEISIAIDFSEGLLEASGIRCVMYQGLGRLDDAVKYEKQGTNIALELKNIPYTLALRNNLVISYVLQGQFQDAVKTIDEIIQISEEYNFQYYLGQSYGFLSPLVKLFQGRIKNAIEESEKGLVITKEVGAPFPTYLTLRNLGEFNILVGHYQDSLIYFQEGFSEVQLTPIFGFPATMSSNLVVLYHLFDLDQHEIDNLIDQTNLVLQLPYGDFWGTKIWCNLASYYLSVGDLEQADVFVNYALTNQSAAMYIYKPEAFFLLGALELMKNNLENVDTILTEFEDYLGEKELIYNYMSFYLLKSIFLYERHAYKESLLVIDKTKSVIDHEAYLPINWKLAHLKSLILDASNQTELASESRSNRDKIIETIISYFSNTDYRITVKQRIDDQVKALPVNLLKV